MTAAPLLCFAPGTCARVPLIALEEIGAPFETRLIAFMAGDHRKPDYLAVNPSGKVPALILPGGVITQNAAILHYLARAHPAAGLLPPASNPIAEAQAIGQFARFSADLHPIVTRIVMTHFFTGVPEAIPDIKARSVEAMGFQLASYEVQLSEREWLLESGWSILDAYLFWVWFRITGAGFDGSTFPHISRHYVQMQERPAVQRALAREVAASHDLTNRGLTVPMPK